VDYQNRHTRNGQIEIYRDIEDEWEDTNGVLHPAKHEFQSVEMSKCMAHYGLCRLFVDLMKYAFEEPSSPQAAESRTQALLHSGLILSAFAL
jgi:hypothetical protein